ncbi:MAG: NAD(P)H-hydrate dehydratase, partial [Candidatus Krumholzibacteriota bacterium]|nr:NAD(P)H-hydrate dehydratase [Candidatus Krumholzibacteriota bacterium]
MYLVTGEQMRAIDRATIDGGHVPGATLMERAGRGMFEVIRRRFGGRLEGRRIVVVCGKGNNGGDGFVIARHLIEHGAGVLVFVLAGDLNLAEDAKRALHKLIPHHPELTKFEEPKAMERFEAALREADLVVDALFGTGIRSDLREPALDIVQTINLLARRVVAVDVPSGVSGDMDDPPRETVRAELTIAAGMPKIGLFYYPGRAAAGEVVTVDIGFPPEIVEAQGLARRLVDAGVARGLLPAFDPASHKYRRGSVLVLAGSRRYGGAALLATGAALRSGCGMVYAGVPASLAPLVQSHWPSAITLALPETEDGSLAAAALAPLRAMTDRVQAVALGPGLGRGEETLDLVRDWLAGLPRPAVLDADALLAFAGGCDALAGHPAPRVLTPHSGELGVLLGLATGEVDAGRGDVLRGAARDGLVLLHKGAPTEVATADGLLHTIAGGHPAMARGGTGDVLTGLLG